MASFGGRTGATDLWRTLGWVDPEVEREVALPKRTSVNRLASMQQSIMVRSLLRHLASEADTEARASLKRYVKECMGVRLHRVPNDN